MSSSDPSLPAPLEPERRENVTSDVPPWAPPSGSPLDRPPSDGPPFAYRAGLDGSNGPTYPDLPRDEAALAPPRKPHPHIGWAILWMLGFMIVTQGAGLVISTVLLLIQLFLSPNRDDMAKMTPKELANSPEFARMMWPGMLITELITILVAFAALRFIAGHSWSRKVALRLPSFPHLLLVLLMVPAFILAGQGADEIAKVVDQLLRDYLWDYSRLIGDLDEMMGMIGYWPWWLGILIIGVGPGIGEELFCRGFLGRGLVANHGYALGVLFTSILFGVMHIIPRQVMYAPVMGVLLHYVYLTTRSLLLPMLIHTLNNSLGALAAWADKSGCTPEWLKAVDQAGQHESFWIVYVGAVVLLAAVMVGLYLSRARLVGADGGPPPWQPNYPSVEYPPALSGTVVIRPFFSGLTALGIGLVGFLAFAACCFVMYNLVG